MIHSLHLKNFKSHKNTFLTLGNLTLLCGQNGGGKSSIIQSLLLLRQSHQKNLLSVGLSLNKPLCNIGKAKDALYQFAENELIEFNIAADNDDLACVFDAENRLELDFMPHVSRETPIPTEIPISLFTKDFQYISAARTAEYLPNDYAIDTEKQLSMEEGKAELTAHFLYKYRTKNVLPALFHQNAVEFDDLLYQVTAWEREISEGVNIIPTKVGGSYEIRYSYNTLTGTTNEFSSKNVGFGLSYALPIIVAILSAEVGSLIIIENPEAHLHPAGQAKLAELMCIAAQAGIQIIVETHSDHIINGTLVGVKQAKMEKEKVKIYYLAKNVSEQAAAAIPVEVLAGGRIKNPPSGFMAEIPTQKQESQNG